MRHFQTISRLGALLTLMTATLCASGIGFSVGGYRAVLDSLNHVFLCSIPQELFGTTWAVTVEGDSACVIETVDGQDSRDGAEVMLHDIQGGKLYPLTVVIDGQPTTSHLTFTWLPVMELDGEFGLEYTEGVVSLHSPDSTGKSDMRAKLKWRGNHTVRPNRHKRNYSIKFLDKNGGKKDRSFFGLRKDNHWKLDAGQVDMLRIRNRVLADLWLDMSTPVWYAESEPKAVNGSRGRIVEVILNGKYEGIYNLMEPVDRKQLQLVKHDTINNEFHGQMWFVKRWCRTATMSQPIDWSNYSPTWEGIEVEYPDFDEVNPTEWGTFADAVYFIRRTDDSDDWNAQADSLEYYFDVPVMEDYFIFISVLQALDNESKNIFYSTHDKADNPRLVMTPWDLDVSTGSLSFSNYTVELVKPERPIKTWVSHIPMYGMFFLSDRHHAQIIDRYWQLRQSWFDTEALVARFQRAVDELEQCGAAAREEARWDGDSDLTGKTLDISAEMEYIADWLRRRLAYLDTHEFARPLANDMNGDGELNIADINALTDIILSTPTNLTGDVNGDGEVNIADLNALIEIILNQPRTE